jgi:peptidoglycan biosynthesis protein MviN/MurJ (putative lipid II flippase)
MLWALSDRLTTAIGLIGVMSSAPVLLVVGAPFGDEGRYPLAVGASVAVWAGLGWWAARRATRVSVAGWPEFWREYTWLAIGVILGVLMAVGTVSLLYGEAFW